MRKYFEKKEMGIYYIAESYNNISGFDEVTKGLSAGRALLRHMSDDFNNPVFGVKWAGDHVIYVAAESEKEEDLNKKGFTIFYHVGIVIGRGGSLWSKYTFQKIKA